MKSQSVMFKWLALAVTLIMLLLPTLTLPSVSAQEETTPTPTETPPEPTPFPTEDIQPIPTETPPEPTPFPEEPVGESVQPFGAMALETPTPPDPDCSDGECVFWVSASTDDAGPNPVFACSYRTNWNEIYMGECPNQQGIVSGFRFANVNIPAEAQIAEAYLEFTVDGPYTDDLTVAFYGEAGGNARSFSSTRHPDNRPLTQASAQWHIPSSDRWDLGQMRASPDLTAIVQEIINRPDWTSGNALAIIVKNAGPASGQWRHRRVIGYDRPVWYPGYENSTRLVIKLEGAFSIDSVTAIDSDGNPLPWDALVENTLTVEARGSGGNPPATVAAKVSALKSGKVTYLTLSKVSTLPDGTHIYRGSRSAGDLVNRPNELTVAALVYEQEEFDYQVAERFMSDLDVPEERRMGIAWGNGDQTLNRPPANIDYFRAAGYEPARIEVIGYPQVLPDEFFIQNQADAFLYLGHGSHRDNFVFLTGSDTQGEPKDVSDAWNEGLKTMVLFGCSVLDINDMNYWWGSVTSPGKKWVDEVPGPQTWLGFQAKAPLVGDPDQQGEEAIYALAEEHTSGKAWVDAWRNATGLSFERPRFVGAVAIDVESCRYDYWKEWDWGCIEDDSGERRCYVYTWDHLGCEDWNSSSQGLQALMASPAEVHIYDQQGRHVGPSEQGGIDTEIPASAYWTPIVAGEPDANARRVSIRAADLSHNYRLRLVGTGEGTFDFFLEIPDRSTGALYQIAYVSVPVSSGAEFVLTLERGTDFVLAADADGDGLFEGRVVPSDIFTRTIDLPVNLALSGTAGENGWYVSDVTAALNASARPDLPSIVSLEYDLGAGWQPYQMPLTITQEGTHTLRYRGTFANGSLDVIQWVNIQIDKTPPVIAVTQPSATTYTLCSTFNVEYEAYDALSGLEAIAATFDGEAITNGQTFDAIFLPPGPHEIVVMVEDRAGWVTTETRTIEVEATIKGLICAKHRLYTMGWIYGPGAPGLVKSLDAKLGAAQRAYDRGQRHASVNILNAFVHEVGAQTGKHITAEAATILIRGARYIINSLTQ